MCADYQLIIRSGTVVDGTGGKPVTADIAISDGLIVKVGNIHGTAEEEIDASGLVVTPGFVDVHTHYDGQITWESRMAPSSNHGVTTVVMGNCGVGFAPCRKGDEDLMIRLMEGVEDIPHAVMATGVPFNAIRKWPAGPRAAARLAMSGNTPGISFEIHMPCCMARAPNASRTLTSAT